MIYARAIYLLGRSFNIVVPQPDYAVGQPHLRLCALPLISKHHQVAQHMRGMDGTIADWRRILVFCIKRTRS